MRAVYQPSATVERFAEVLVSLKLNLAGVDAHPHHDPVDLTPGLLPERALAVNRRLHGATRAAERGKDAVPA
jgi:hypothetical protein